MKFKLINVSYLESISSGDIEIIREIVDIFKSQTPEFVSEMKSSFNNKDYHSLGMLAHKAKSSIAIMGMEDLALMLKKLELNAKSSTGVEEYPAFLSRFEKETDEAIIELESYLNSH